MMFRTGLVSITFRSKTAVEIIRLAESANLQSIEWGGDVHVPPDDFANAAEVGALTHATGLSVSAYGSYYRFQDVLPHPKEAGPPYQSVLETAQALGCPCIRVWAGDRSSRETDAPSRTRIIEQAKRMGDAAQAMGMRIDFEFHFWTLTDTLDSTCDLIEAIDHPGVGLYWQPYPFAPFAENLKNLKQLADRVGNVHCFQWGVEKAWEDKRLLKTGEKEWMAYIAVLNAHPKERHLSLEFVKDNTVENFRDDAATLNAWAAGEKS